MPKWNYRDEKKKYLGTQLSYETKNHICHVLSSPVIEFQVYQSH